MNDARMSADLIAYEREREKEVFRSRARELALSGQTPGRPRGVLSVEEAAARLAFQEEVTAPAEDVRAVSAAPSAPVSPEGALRSCRLGVVAVVVLVLLLVWVRRRRVG